ncbi:glycoside hydrolase family 47 protein [Streptacidiphilus melanogenes]|uniref:glycoside hydrolase family 47 protein n=1 Tax=Streptacidiphilus melanogenes TaxID=411235 RepID=UPI000A7E839E|nr:glycoside hydrolase family 47 protein [Streptacidiphilus melanogenes]
MASLIHDGPSLPLPLPEAHGPGARGSEQETGSGSTRRRVLTGAGVAASALVLGVAASGRQPASADARLAAEVHSEFLHGWRGYRAAAWGYDEVRPLSGTHHDFFAPGRTFGLTIVEALDTLFLMGENLEAALCCDWIEQHLDPVQDASVQVFEAVIRLVGGVLAGYQATGRRALLGRARELADRLLPAFTASPTGLPYTHVNLRTGAVHGDVATLAEIGSNALEFGLLSRLTGDARYYEASVRAYRAAVSRRSALDLLGTSLHVETGRWTDTAAVAPNAPVDSFYEYLYTAGAQFRDRTLRSWYRTLTAAILRHQAVRIGGRLWFRAVDFRSGRSVGTRTRQQELGSFYAGLLAKGGAPQQGVAYFDSWTAVLDRHPVLPESVDCATLRPVDPSGLLRPEYANAAFDLWRMTGLDRYRQAAYRWFTAMRERQRVPGGYTTLRDVTAPPGSPQNYGDLTPGYWFAENLKYLWLMFSATPRFDYRVGLLSTEGKALVGLRQRWV